jgi:ATP synthase subunit G
MASQTQGIQQLLSAEKRAAEKVSEARKRKNRRLKQAKEEAQAEIEKYKSERETQFREHEARYAGSKGDVAARYCLQFVTNNSNRRCPKPQQVQSGECSNDGKLTHANFDF